MSHRFRFPFAAQRGVLTVFIAAICLLAVGCETKAETSNPDDTSSEPAAAASGAAEENEDERPQNAEREAVDVPRDPFQHKSKAPEFPKDMTWLNTGGPIRMRDLKGKFVLLDFWCYCCINCMHILPELKKLEKAYPNNVVVIGVHSAKFANEKFDKNIEEAILRYEIEHPVVNDGEHRIWDLYRAQSWPSLRVVDPEGNWVAEHSGEITFEQLDGFFKQVLPYYRDKGVLDETPVRFELLEHQQTAKTPLRFPGKVLADEASDRLFIADSSHNRIVIASLDGELIEIIGAGTLGAEDGEYATATFNDPQGMALHGSMLYVADNENHLLRKVDLTKKTVTTIAGTGVQSRNPWPGLEKLGRFDDPPDRWVGKPKETPISSPWALWVHDDALYIAMAGPHQIWKMPLDESEIGPYAGNGREDIVDGALLPPLPYREGSAFAQPSGLTSDGTWLYVADSEGSSIRAVPFDPTKEVRTLVGTSKLPFGRLFAFGDQDGKQAFSEFEVTDTGQPVRDADGELKLKGVLFQHCLGVTYHDGKIYVADTYNNKVRAVDAKTGETSTFAGTGQPGADDEAGTFDEPAGISYAGGKLYVADTNNHLIRSVDLVTKIVATLRIDGLSPPSPPRSNAKPTFVGAVEIKRDAVQVKPTDNAIRLSGKLSLPLGWKINKLAPMGYFVEAVADNGSIDRSKLSQQLTKISEPATTFEITVPISGAGKDVLRVGLNFFYCQEGGEGLCKVGSVVWTIPLTVDQAASNTSISLDHNVTE